MLLKHDRYDRITSRSLRHKTYWMDDYRCGWKGYDRQNDDRAMRGSGGMLVATRTNARANGRRL